MLVHAAHILDRVFAEVKLGTCWWHLITKIGNKNNDACGGVCEDSLSGSSS
jgi:hypothetical protein